MTSYHGLMILLLLVSVNYCSGIITIVEKMSNVTVEYCTIFSKTIPRFAYFDSAQNTNDLKLELLDQNRNPVAASDRYAQLNSKDQTLYVVPVYQSTVVDFKPGVEHQKYFIRARNQNTGDFIDDLFYVTITGRVPTRTFAVKFRSYALQSLTDIENLYHFINGLYTFSNRNLTNKDVQVFGYFFEQGSGRLELSYQNCTIPDDGQCHLRNYIQMNNLFDLYDKPKVVPKPLSTVMSSYFNVTSISNTYFGNCKEGNLSPGINPNYIRSILIPYGMNGVHIPPYPGMHELIFPSDLFTHEYPEYTIRVQLAEYVAVKFPPLIPKTFWAYIYYRHSIQKYVFEAVLTDSSYNFSSATSSKATFNVLATDDKKDIVSIVLVFLMSPPVSYYFVTFQFSNFNLNNTDVKVVHMRSFMNILIQSLGSYMSQSYRELVFLKSFDFTSNTVGEIAWGLNVLPGCNFDLIQATQRIMFLSESDKTVRRNFKSELSKLLTLVSIQEHFKGPCSQTTPSKVNTPPPFNVKFCGIRKYIVPENTFFDKEDGGTRNLSLSLRDNQNKAIHHMSWIQFNNSTQTIIALPSTESYTADMNRVYTYKLIATDKSGLKVTCDMTINLIGQPNDVTYRVTIRGSFQSNQILNPSHVVAEKVLSWFQYPDFQLISHAKTSNNEELISFTNCSWRTSPCDAFKVHEYKTSLFPANDQVSQAFKDRLKPEFNNPFITGTVLGACARNNRPKVNLIWGPLLLSPCTTFKQTVPEKTFLDVEQNNTRNLRLTLQRKPDALTTVTTTSLPYWCEFDASKQELTMLSFTNLNPKSYEYELAAFDVEGESAVQNLMVNLPTQSNAPSHEIILKIKVVSSSLNSYVKLYNRLRESLRFYFSDSIDTVEYLTVTNYPSSQYEVRWCNCSISKTKCDASEMQKLQWIQSRLMTLDVINPSFKLSLSTDFTVDSVEFKLAGICKTMKKPPVLLNPIPAQAVQYCSYKRFKIPANTFKDDLEGSTRNLTLTFKTQNGFNLPTWLSFDSTKQELTFLLQSVDPPAATTYVFNVTASTKRVPTLSASATLTINIVGAPLPLKTYLRAILSSPLKGNHVDIYATLLNKISSLFNENVNKLHLYDAGLTTTGSQAIVRANIINCNLDNCTAEFIQELNTALSSNKYDFKLLNPEFTKSQMSIRPGKTCGKKKPPRILQPPRPFTVKRCETFSKRISDEVFDDDDGLESLVFTLVSSGGSSLEPWITMIGQFIVGIVNNDVIKNKPPSSQYNLTIRARNKYDLIADTWVLVTVEGDLPQLYYQYDMTFTDNNLQTVNMDAGLWRQREISKKMQTYFSAGVMNIVSYQAGTGNQMSLRWSVCNLVNKCTVVGISDTANKIYDTNDAVLNNFKNIFPREFSLVSIQKVIDPNCLKPITPPIPRENPLKIETTYCGGLTYAIPRDLFTDSEDSFEQLLFIFEKSRGQPLSTAYPWLHFNQKTQILRGMPTYDQARDMVLNSQTFLLTVRDTSGLETTINVNIDYILPPFPKYIFVFSMSTFDVTNVDLRFTFMDKIAAYLGDSNRDSIGINAIASTHISYFNCSILYQPCDLYQLNRIKARFSDSMDVPRSQLFSAFQPEFGLGSVSSNILKPCGGPNSPTVNATPPVIVITVCDYFTYQVPSYTFYDLEEGHSRNLRLALTVKTGSIFSMSNFVQYTSSTQSVLMISKAQLLQTYGSTFHFTLSATDNTDLSTSTDLTINIQGPYSILMECQIQVTLQRSVSVQSRTDMETILFIINSLSSYFQITKKEIGIVDFYSISNSQNFYFSWSYCSSLYRQSIYQSNSATLKVDYYNFQSKVLMKLFHSDRKTIHTNFRSAFTSEYSVVSVNTAFTKRCLNLPPIVPPGVQITMIIGYGGYATHLYRDNYFYDYEDGWAYSLTINLLNSDGKQVLIDSWINVNVTTHNIYAVIYDVIRFSVTSSYTFFLQATDSGGKNTRIEIKVVKDGSHYTFAPFNITYLLEYSWTSYSISTVYSEQSSLLIDRIISYFTSISKTDYVLVRWYWKSIGFRQYRVITWSVADHTCASTVLSRVQAIYQSGNLDAALVSSVSNMFTLKRLYYQTTCPGPVVPPKPPITLPTFNITYCSIFVYQLPVTLFYDDFNGEANTMKLTLLDRNGNAVTPSSWIQLNTATMQIYAVAVQSYAKIQSSYQYKIQATNSAGLTSIIGFKADLNDYPHTADCKMTMQFKYKQETTTLVDLDVIRTFMSSVSSYYGDSSTKIKILNFYKRVNSSYEVTWSNCSFSFASRKTALYGLTENDRTRITRIFSRIVTSSNEVVTNFKTHMSTYFSIMALSVNYDCIEEPPFARGNQTAYAKFCELFNVSVPATTFYDKRDGDTRNLKLKITDANGIDLPLSYWLQLDEKQNLFGIVTEKVRDNAPLQGYKYKLIATDSSGRSANITYTVKVTSPKRDFAVFYRTGFTNYFGDYANTARILYEMVKNLATYIDPADQVGLIYVKKFRFPSMLEWSHCTLLPCQPQNVINILNKLVTSNGVVTNNFINAMRPKAFPKSTRLNIVNGKECSSTVTNVTVVPPAPNKIIPNCGYFTYALRANLFRDFLGNTINSFYLSLFYVDGSPIPSSSWIQFNATHQFIYGISILSKLQQKTTYLIEARHPTSGSRASVLTTITTKDYEQITKISTKLCLITFKLNVKYNQGYDDVSILLLFMKTLANYMGVDYNQIQIYSYTRKTSHPYEMYISWTNCTLTRLFMRDNYVTSYYTQLKNIITRFSSKINGQYVFKQEIKTFFLKNSLFQLNTVMISGNCSTPPNIPPKPMGDISISAKCGLLNFQIPDNAFQDEDGGTRQLTLTLLTSSNQVLPPNTWVYLTSSQSIQGHINNGVIQNAINSQYIFTLRAKDNSGLTGDAKVIITVPSSPMLPTVVEVQNSLILSVQFEYEVQAVYLFVERLETFLREMYLMEIRLYIYEWRKPSASSPAYTALLTSCVKCSDGIDITLMSLSDVFSFIAPYFSPELALLRLLVSQSSVCSDIYPPGRTHNETIPYCDFWSFDLRKIDGPTLSNYEVNFLDGNGNALPSDSWAWMTNYTIEAYPKPSFWSNPNKNQVYLFSYDIVQFTIRRKILLALKRAEVNPDTIDFKIILKDNSTRTQFYDNFYINLVMKALKNLVGSGKGLHFVSFTVLNENPFTFEVKWQNCTLPISCDNSDITQVNSILYNSNSLANLGIKKYFPTQYEIVDLDNRCRNQPPVPTQRSLNLTATICGLYTYKLNESLAVDGNDGGVSNLDVTLLQSAKTVLPRNSWIRYNKTSKQIYALPNEGAASLNQIYNFQMQFQDKRDAATYIPVNVKVEKNRQSFYDLSITFNSRLPVTTPYLDIQVRLLRLISLFTEERVNLEKYRVLTFSHAGNERFFLKFGDCSINETICKSSENQLAQIESTMFTSSSQLTTRFQSFIGEYFTGITMQRETSNLKVDQPPRNINVIQIVILNRCQATSVKFKQAFFDAEESQDTLTFELKFISGQTVPLSYWIQIQGDNIYVYPWLSVSPGIYSFTLTATDKCGSRVSLTISVNVKDVYTGYFGYQWRTFATVQRNNLYPDVYYLAQIREQMITYLQTKLGSTYPDNQLQILSYVLSSNEVQVLFGQCSITYQPCDQAAITRLINAMFIGDNIPNQELVAIFQSIATLNRVEGSRQYPCGSNPSGPKCKKNKLVINATLCSDFKIDISDLCLDDEDGGMMNLKISFLTTGFEQVPRSSWVQFNKTIPTIYGYPSYSKNTNISNPYNYVLQVADQAGNKTIIEVCVYIQGKRPTLDYQVNLGGQLTVPDNRPDVDYRIDLTMKLKRYFGETMLNSVQFGRNGATVTYIWSFCSMRADPCDCLMVKRTQDLIQNNMDYFKWYMKSSLSVEKVQYNLYGACEQTKSPKVENGISEVIVTIGQPYETILPYNQFIDAEDGMNANLTLVIRDSSNNIVSNIDWMTLDGNMICGLMDRVAYIKSGYTKDTVKEYRVVATDACGKEAVDSYQVKFKQNFPSMVYRILLQINMPFSKFSGNCSNLKILIKNIAEYAKISTSRIVIDQISTANGSVNGTYLVWGPDTYTKKDCNNKNFEVFRELFVRDEKGNNNFIQKMLTAGYDILGVTEQFDGGCDTFPWWILILIFVFLLLLLLLWLLWLCIPRCCSTCCGRLCRGCVPCCTKGGKYSSHPIGCCGKKDNRKATGYRDMSDLEEDKNDSIDGGVTGGNAIFIECHENVSDDEVTSDRGMSPSNKDTADGAIDNRQHVEDEHIYPLPLPPPVIPGKAPISRGEGFHTEAWTDDRGSDVYHRVARRRSFDDIYYDLYSGYGYSDKRYRSDKQHDSFERYRNESDGRKRYIRYMHQPQLYRTHRVYENNQNRGIYAHDQYRSSRYDDDSYLYNGKHELRKIQHNAYNTGKHVQVKQPVEIRLRRSELEDYLKYSSQKGKKVLTSKDVEHLVRRNAKLSVLKRSGKQQKQQRYRFLKSKPRFSEIEADNRYEKEGRFIIDSPDKLHGRQRSYSTSSLSDLVVVDQHGRDAVITPRNISFKLHGVEKGGYTSSSSNEIIVASDKYDGGAYRQQRRYLVYEPTAYNRSSELTAVPRVSNVKTEKLYDVTRRDQSRSNLRKRMAGHTAKSTFINRSFVQKGSEV